MQKNFGVSGNKVVCVCNATYCDQLGKLEVPPKSTFSVYVSTEGGYFFERTDGHFEPTFLDDDTAIREGKLITGQNASVYTVLSSFETNKTNKMFRAVQITLNAEKKRQRILGFGGAFTDAAGYNINQLADKIKETLIR
jgi:glucosylceramidase